MNEFIKDYIKIEGNAATNHIVNEDTYGSVATGKVNIPILRMCGT
jgi:hypothetical protein